MDRYSALGTLGIFLIPGSMNVLEDLESGYRLAKFFVSLLFRKNHAL